jgi:hypothetical protein
MLWTTPCPLGLHLNLSLKSALREMKGLLSVNTATSGSLG